MNIILDVNTDSVGHIMHFKVVVANNNIDMELTLLTSLVLTDVLF